MKHISVLIYFAAILVLSACTDDEVSKNSYSVEKKSMQDVIFQMRNSKLPNVTDKGTVSTAQTRAIDLNGVIIGNSDAVLGYSYKIGNSILGDYNNVGFPIIDIAKVKNYDPTYIASTGLKTATAESFSYSDIDNYLNKSQVLKKTSSGFSINVLNIFRIGRKHKTTQLFSSYERDSIHSVYGEMNLKLSNSKFQLLATQENLHTYTQGFLTKSFMKNLYGSTPANILSQYGDFLMAGYITGGKATVLLAGLSASSVNITDKEKMMDQSFSGYIDWKIKKVSGKISLDSLSIGKNNGTIKAHTHYLNMNRGYVYTYGGKQGLSAVGKFVDMDISTINLTPWAQSLDDENTHTLIDITDNGLLPLSSVVLEDNYKKRLDYTSAGILPRATKPENPYIEIAKYYVRYSDTYRKPLYNIAAILNTRQGDKIILCDTLGKNLPDAELVKNSDNTIFIRKASEIAKKMEKYFEIEIKSNVYAKYNPVLCNPLCEVVICNGDNLHWCQDKNSGLYYIYDKQNKVAFSVYDDDIDGDYVLDDYGIRDWFESNCIKRSINTGTITRSFKIIGL
jgi:hypothetical protein